MLIVQCVELNAMKKNRSNKFTQGIVITNHTNELRFLFFEIDKPLNQAHMSKVIDVYQRFGCDLLIHRTGNGWHFLSPNLHDLQKWKEAMTQLRDINKKCPMTTLRWIPNKHPNEDQIWFTNEYRIDPNNIRRNSHELSQLLNHVFKTPFEGTITTELKMPWYPLP